MHTPVPVAIVRKPGSVLSWQDDLAEGFRQVGAEPVFLDLRPARLDEYRAKWRTRARAMENVAVIARTARTLRDSQPRLVVVPNFAGLPPATAEAWREALPPGVPIVGWVCDHLERLPEQLSPNLDGVYYFDSIDVLIGVVLAIEFAARLAHLALAVNPDRYPDHGLPFDQRRRDLVFAGDHTAERRAAILAFRDLGGHVSARGPHAPCGLRVWRRRRLDAAKLARLYGRHFAVFNLLQPPNTVHGLNLRAFEAPAAGALATYPEVPDLPGAFEPDEEVVVYRDLPGLKEKIDQLQRDPARAAAIAAAGRARVLREHTFAHRAARILADWLGETRPVAARAAHPAHVRACTHPR